MKILLVDNSIDGHHMAYMSELINIENHEYVVVLPSIVESIKVKQYAYKPVDFLKKKFIPYIKWICEIREIARLEQVDAIHFLYADIFYKYFGVGLGLLNSYKLILTLHWVRTRKIERLSLRVFGKKGDILIVHSEYLLDSIKQMKIKNGIWIEYPQFKGKMNNTYIDSCEYWGLDTNIPIIGCIGGTRYDKGLDLLLEALKKVRVPYQLLIAGKAESFDEKFIDSMIENNTNKVIKVLRYLSDNEVDMAIEASNIIALPYRYSFNGASGPLSEGVCKEKCIVGPKHGNLGYIIDKYHLGYVFETEMVDDLEQVLTKVLVYSFNIDKSYLEYKAMLNVEFFLNSYKKIYDQI